MVFRETRSDQALSLELLLEDKGFASDNSLEYERQDPAASAPNGDGCCGPKIPQRHNRFRHEDWVRESTLPRGFLPDPLLE